ncbi:MAG: c-type cytochrome [Stellaceae bacterium]
MPASENLAVVAPETTLASVTADVSGIVLRPQLHLGWWIGLGIALALVLLLTVALGALSVIGVGIWGVTIPTAWGFAIANYIWWTDIATGGALISALFLLTGADWRTATHRIAETMMLFAAAAGGLMPIFHLGRYWYAYWLFPYTNVMGTWPQFRSPLHWDFVGIIAFIVGAVVFWSIALIPDLATLRDRASHRTTRVLYGVLAMGWQGSSTQWRHFRAIYLAFAGLMVAEAVAAHSIAGLDLSGGMTPGWHSTFLPPYFVIGAALVGFAVLLMLLIPLRLSYPIGTMVTLRHIEVLARLLLASSWLIAYCYAIEAFMPFYSGKPADLTTINAAFYDPYAFAYWSKIALNVILPQLLWFRRILSVQKKDNTWRPAQALPDLKLWPPTPPAHTIALADVPVKPPPLTLALLERGRQRFDIYCAPCHSPLADGHGRIVERGFPAPPSFLTGKLRKVKFQQIYDAITHGHGIMYSYASRVMPRDRWAIAAYIRALEQSQDTPLAALSPKEQAELSK